MMKHKKWLSSVVLTAFMLTNLNIPAFAAEVGNTAAVTEGYTVNLPTAPQVATGSAITPVPSGSGGNNETGKVHFAESGSYNGDYKVGILGESLSYIIENKKLLVIFKSNTDTNTNTNTNTDSGQMTTAFGEDTYVERIILEDGVANIIDNAFSQCTNLQSVYIADSVTEIGNDPFTNYDNLTIYGSVGSAAEQYAQETGLPFYPAAVNEKHTLLYAAQPVETVAVDEATTGTVTVRNADGTAGGRVTWSVADESMLQIVETAYDAATGSTTVQLAGLQAGETTITASTEDGTSLTETVTVTRAAGTGQVKTGTLGETVSWTLADGVLTVSGTGTATGRLDYTVQRLVQELVVEEGITAFGDYMFENCSALTKVTLPSTLTSIGKGAFSNCRALRAFQVPETITSIEDYAFMGCTSLEHIYIPATVTSIARWAFNGCAQLSIYGVASSYAETYALQYDIPFSTQVQGGDGSLIYIDQDGKVLAVGGTMNLTATGNAAAVDWTVSDDSILKILEAGADGSSVQLQGLKAGEATVTATANGASTSRTIRVLDTFGTCGDNLTWNFTDGVLTISGNGEMKGRPWYFLADQIRTVIVEEGVTTIAACAFSGYENLTTVTLPSTLTEIGEVAFEGSLALQQIDIPANVTKIGLGAFRGCGSLTEVVIPEGVTAIEMQTFAECTALTRVVLPERLQSIGDYAFGQCPSLGEINLPTTLTTIGNNVFVGGESLQAIVLPDSLTSIGSAVFSGCQNLREVTFPAGLKTIPQNMFMCCTSLQNVTLPNGLETIESDAFSGCESFTTLTFPANVTSIGDRAFYGCTNITEIYFLGNAPQTGRLGFLDGSLSGATAYYPADNATWTALSAMDRANYGGFYIEWVALGEVGQVTSVELDRIKANMIIGDTLQLQATVKPDTAVDKTLTWSSSDQTVATVNADGMVTALQTGSAIITVTTNDGGYTAKCTVSITPNSTTESGYCNFYDTNSGRNIYWTYEPDTGVLTLQGEGEIIDFYVDSAYSVPDAFHKATTVILEEGITRVGTQVFHGCDNIENLVIADSVTEIGDCAFYDCIGLKNVHTGDGITSLDAFPFGPALEHIEIGASITEIPDGQFQNCTSLSEITIPNQITRIGNSAFAGCTGLQEIVIPAFVQELGANAFYGCNALKTVNIPDNVTLLGECVFANCIALENVVIGDGVETIPAGAFYGCSNLKDVKLGNNISIIDGTEKHEEGWTSDGVVESFGGGAFENCSALQAIDIPDSTTVLGAHAFAGCTGLQEVVIPVSVQQLGNGVFYGCSALKTITMPSGGKKLSIGAGAFENCSSLSQVTLSEQLEVIGSSAFKNCTSLQEIVIPASVQELGDNAFYGCSVLKTIAIPDGIKKLSAGAFENCVSLWQATLPKQLEVVENDVFKDCTALQEIILPDTVTSVGDYAFENCSALEKLVLSDGLKTIDGYAVFSGCDHLKYVDTGNELTSLGGFSKSNFANLETMIIGDSIVDLGEESYLGGYFSGISSLKKIVLGQSIVKINRSEFSGCTSLSDVTLGENIVEIGADAFSHCSSLEEILIPDSVIEIGESAFSYCSSLKEIMIPDNVTTINLDAFRGCTALQAVNTGNGISNLDGFSFRGSKVLREIVIGDRIEKVPEYMFNSCTALETVKLGNSIQEVGNWAFSNCISLTSVEIPASVGLIGVSAFGGCENLKTVILNEGVQTIASSSFHNCKSLTSIELPESVGTVGSDAFGNCESLKTVTLNEGLQTIEPRTFINCKALTSIELPANIETIGVSAFENCEGLKTVTLNKKLQSINESAFSHCSSLTAIQLPAGITNIGSRAFAYSGLETMIWPEGMPEIGNEIFSNCSSLKWIEIPSTVTSISYSAFDDCSYRDYEINPETGNAVLKDLFHIYGYEGSYAETYADWVNIPFYSLGKAPGSTTSQNGTSISMNSGLVCELGKTLDVGATAIYPTGNVYKTNWSVGDGTIVQIQEVLTDGTEESSLGCSKVRVLGLKIGETTITATTEDGASVTQIISVKEIKEEPGIDDVRDPVTMIDIPDTIEVGRAYDLDAYFNSELPIANTKWSVSPKNLVYFSEENDVLVGLKPGTITLKATFRDETLSRTVTIESNQQTKAKIVTKNTNFYYEKGSYDTEELPFIAIIVNDTDTAQEEQLTFTVDVQGVKFKDKFLFIDTETEKLTSKKFTIQPGEAYVYEGVVTVKDFVPEQKTYKQEVVITCARQHDYALSSEFTIVNYDSTSTGNSSKPGNYTPQDFKTQEQREAATWMQQLYSALAEIENTKKVRIDVEPNDIEIGLGAVGISLDKPTYEKITKNILLWRALKGSEMMKETSGYNKNNYYLKLSGIKTATDKKDVVLLVKDNTYLNLSWGKLDSIECIAYVDGKKKAKTLLGVQVEGDPKAFATELRRYVKKSQIENLENFSKEIMKDAAFEAIKNQTEDEFLKTIVEACEFYDKYFADTKEFVETLCKVDMAVITAREYTAALEQQLNASYEAVIEVACPVDVYVYDSAGNLYGQIINNQVDDTVTVIPMWVEGDRKYFKVFDEDYTVKLVGNDVGTMDYIITEYEDGENKSRTIEFLNLPLTAGKTYTGIIPSEAYMPSEAYALVADTGEVIQKDTDTYQGTGLSGTITSYGDANAETTIRLLQDNAEVYTTTGTGNSTSYTFPAVAAGTYEMEVSKQGHATYHETITVGSEGLTKDITIYLLGDVTGDGKVNITDVNKLFRHVNKQITLEDFRLPSADTTKDGRVNITDVNKLFRYVNKQIDVL